MSAEASTGRRVLVADDEPANVMLLVKILRRAGYDEVRGTTESREILPLHGSFAPDVLLLDLHMPGLNGFEILAMLREVVGADDFFPVLVLTADTTAQTRERALAGGAHDFLSKPFDQTEVLLRVGNLLGTRSLHRRLRDQNLLLEDRVRERTRDLEEARLEVLERLSLAAEFRDDDTGQHTQRVGRVSALLAHALGLPDAEVELLRRAAPLHDVGKISIPDAVLLKPGKLDPGEWRVMRTHTTTGGRILGGSRSPVLQTAERIALTHHECWDGSGYPAGLRGEEIPLAGRIVSVADVFDALTHARPYKKPWAVDEAVAEIARLAGQKFDPSAVAAFLDLAGRGLLAGTPAGASTVGAGPR